MVWTLNILVVQVYLEWIKMTHHSDVGKILGPSGSQAKNPQNFGVKCTENESGLFHKTRDGEHFRLNFYC